VKAGSTAMRNGSPSEKRKDWLTDQLVTKGVLASHPTNPNLWVFTQDYEFTSPSAAGDVINDGNLSAPQYWRNTLTGKTLKEDLAGIS
jgi:5-methylcytosine-specific restriction protein B